LECGGLPPLFESGAKAPHSEGRRMLLLELILLLLAATAALELLARRIGVPRPTLLVIGGLLIAMIPGLPVPEFDPELLFLIFIPPLLYRAAINTSLRDLRMNLRAIGMLAVGLVIASIGAVAFVAHGMTPEMTLAAAFVLGSIVAPPDPIAAIAVTERLHLTRNISAILEGEGLLNDAIALVAYRMAVTATISGRFSWRGAALEIVTASIGGIAIGLLLGWLIMLLRRHLEAHPIVENTISLLTPFAAYIPADRLGVSGILSVVTVGLYISRDSPRVITASTRLQSQAIWSLLTFLLEGVVFILIGLELPHATAAVRSYGLTTVIGYAAIITGTIVLVRMAWVFPSAYLPRIILRRLGRTTDWPSWQQVLFVGWAGLRGADSLVIALALPLRFPARDLILFITFVVILVSLIVQGLSLAPLIRVLRLPCDEESPEEEREARRRVTEAGLKRLEKVRGDKEIVAGLRERHSHRAHRYGEGAEAKADQRDREEYRRLRRAMLDAERAELIRLRDKDVINDDVLRRVQRDLDLEELLLTD
jgi:Na+/H+ antiporter